MVLVQKACDITKSLMPNLECKVLVHRKDVPEINGGYFILSPLEELKNKLVTVFSNQSLTVLVFGDLISTPYEKTAEVIWKTWTQAGIEGVRNLDGCFSSIIVDRLNKEVFLVSDLLGLRSLTYYYNNETLLVSMHDVPIVATGLCRNRS